MIEITSAGPQNVQPYQSLLTLIRNLKEQIKDQVRSQNAQHYGIQDHGPVQTSEISRGAVRIGIPDSFRIKRSSPGSEIYTRHKKDSRQDQESRAEKTEKQQRRTERDEPDQDRSVQQA